MMDIAARLFICAVMKCNSLNQNLSARSSVFVGIIVAAGGWPRCVSLVRATEVAIAKVPAVMVAETGQFLQLVEVFRAAAELPVAAILHSTSVPPTAILLPVLRAVYDVVHAETLFYLMSVVVSEALHVTSAIAA